MTGTFKIVNANTEYILKSGKFISKHDLEIKGYANVRMLKKQRPQCMYAIDICVDEDLQKRDEFTEMDIYNQKPFFFK